MTHDSRRYHRLRRPPLARGYGMLGALGEAAGSAASAVGSGLESAAGAVAPAATSALGSLGQGVQSLFGSGGGEAGKLASLGQAVPEGVELAGPSSTFTGPGFLSSVAQGFVHGPQQFASPSAGTSFGQGVGGLLQALDQMNSQRQGGMSIQPIVGGVTGVQPLQGPRVIPGGSAQPATGPIMSLLKVIGSL